MSTAAVVATYNTLHRRSLSAIINHKYFLHNHLPSQYQLRRSRQLSNNSPHPSSPPSSPPSPPSPPSQKRRLDVAIVGPPNAGKSQLLNTITSTTIAAVSRKRHTTRNSGILATYTSTQDDGNGNGNGNVNNDIAQLVFIDTPGFVRYSNSPKEKTLYKDLVEGARESMDRADYTLVVIDAAKKVRDELRNELAILMLAGHHSRGRIDDVKVNDDGELEEVLSGGGDHQQNKEKFAIVLNKVDLVNPKDQLLDIAEDIGALGDACVRYRGEMHDDGRQESVNDIDNDIDIDAMTMMENTATKFTREEEMELAEQYPPVFFISALKNDGIDDLLKHLCSLATPTKNFVLPPDQKTSLSLVERIEEVIREKIYRCLHREVPHSITQVNRVLKRGKTVSGKFVLRIDQDLVVRTKSHQKLVLGRGGMTLRRIQETARRDLLKILSSDGYDDILLNLHVKFSKSRQNRNLESDNDIVQRTF